MKNYSNNITGIMNCVKDCVQQAYDKGYKQGLAESKVEVKDAEHIWYKRGQYISLNRFLEAKAEAYKDGYNVGRVYREDADKKKPCVDEIKVGDEIICAGTGTRKLVLKVIDVKGVLHYMCFSDERGYSTESENLPPKKTGRHFDIDKILEQMKEVDK
jgi:hypothetical protein